MSGPVFFRRTGRGSPRGRLGALVGRNIADVRAELVKGGDVVPNRPAAPWYTVGRHLAVDRDGTLWAALGFGRFADVLDRACPLHIVYNALTGKIVGARFRHPRAALPLIALAEGEHRPAAHVWSELVDWFEAGAGAGGAA